MKAPQTTDGNWIATDIGVKTEGFKHPGIANICVTMSKDTDVFQDARVRYPNASEEKANIKVLSVSKKMGEFINTIEAVLRIHGENHPPKPGDWNWPQLADKARSILLEAGYTDA